MPRFRCIPGGLRGRARDRQGLIPITCFPPTPHRPEPTFSSSDLAHTTSTTLRYSGDFSEPATAPRETLPSAPAQSTRFQVPAQQSSKPPVPTDVFPLTRVQFQLIKCIHHLHLLNSAIPPSLHRQRQQLLTKLRPAFCDDDFRQAAARLADRWAEDSASLLRDHYAKQLDTAAQALSRGIIPQQSFDLSISFACGWARRQLGRRLSKEVLRQAVSRLEDIQARSLSKPCIDASTPSHRNTGKSSCTPVADVSVPYLHTNNIPDEESSGDWVALGSPSPSPASNVSYVRTDHTISALIHTVPEMSSPEAPITPFSTCAENDCPLLSPSTENSEVSAQVVSAKQLHSENTPQGILLAASGSAQLRPQGYRFCPASQGRLSQLRAAASSADEDLDIRRAVILLSLEDHNNKPTTLWADLKSLLGRCRRLYPGARLVVVFPVFPGNLSPSSHDTLKNFLRLAKEKKPSGASILHAPANASTATLQALISGDLNCTA